MYETSGSQVIGQNTALKQITRFFAFLMEVER